MRPTDAAGGGRNAVELVVLDGVPARVVKRSDPADAAREAARLERLAGGPLHRHVPALLGRAPGVVVTEWIDGAPLGSQGEPGPAVLAELGSALARLHAMPAGGAGRPPWVTRLHRPTPRRIAWASAALLAVIRAVQADPAVCGALDGLARRWTGRHLVHGDMRWANVLVRAGAAPRIVVVDWEASGPGMPETDLGAVVGDLLRGWAGRLDPPSPRAARTALRRGGVLARALWTGHGGTGDPAETVRWAGARLLQAAAEDAQRELFPPPGTAGLLAGAAALLTAPEVLAGMIAGNA